MGREEECGGVVRAYSNMAFFIMARMAGFLSQTRLLGSLLTIYLAAGPAGGADL